MIFEEFVGRRFFKLEKRENSASKRAEVVHSAIREI